MSRPPTNSPALPLAPARPQRLARQLRDLMSASVAITAAHALPEILDTIAARARRVVGAEQALVDVCRRGDSCARAFSGGRGRRAFDLERNGAHLTSLAHQITKPVRLESRQLRSQLAPANGAKNELALRGWMAAPLVGRHGKRIGVVQLANKDRGQFNYEDEFLLVQLAQFAAAAVENARLYSEAQTQLAERARAEESLRLYRQIFASSSEAIAIVDPQGFYVEQNDAHRQLLGYSDEQLRGATPSVHLGDTAFADIARQLRRTGEYRGELVSRARNGEPIDLDLSAFTVRNPAGEVMCHVGIKRDITARKHDEAEVRARVRQQSAVVELGRRALAGTDLDELLQSATELVATSLDSEYSDILELLPGGRELLLRAGYGWHEGLVGKFRLSAGLESQAGYTLLSSEPVVVRDPTAETRFSSPSFLLDHKVISGISVIIGEPGRPFGVLGAHSTRPRNYTAEDVTFLTATANMLATIIERKRMEQESRARVRQQVAVVELGRRALAGAEIAELMQYAAELVATTLGNELCKVLELLPDGHTLRLIAGVGWKPGHVGLTTLSADATSHAGFTLLSSGPVIIEDLRTETRFTEPLLQEHGVVSGMSVLIEGHGQPFGVVGTHSTRLKQFTSDDVTFLAAVANVLAAAIERKRVELELRQSEERFRRAQRSANIGAYEWDLRSGAVKWSEELPVLRGLASDGQFATWLKHVHPDDWSRVTETLDRAIATRGDFDLELRLMTAQGNVWLATRGQVFPDYVLGVVVDITGRKQAEELLRRSEKLAVVGRLAATIAHEINNPLESVTNLLYLLEQHPTLDSTAHNYATLAQQELHRVAHIARQTLNFYRESATAVPVRLPELLENVLQMYARRITDVGIQVERRYDFDQPVSIFPAEMQQVISNLILNAVEALGSRGRLIVHLASATEWATGRRQRGVRLVVADTGPGIPPESRQRIFEPFFTTKGEKGTGLGLWVISGIVNKHQGSIRLRSSVAPGHSFTCFSVFLPLHLAEVAGSEEKARPTGLAA